MPTISFLILTYNSSSYIKRLLDSIFSVLHSEIERGEVEIIVEDNASHDNTVKVVEEYKKARKILFFMFQRKTKGMRPR